MDEDRHESLEYPGLGRRLAAIGSQLENDPGDIALRAERADLLRLLGDDDAAIEDLDAILAHTPHDREALERKADLLEARGDHAGALGALGAVEDPGPELHLRRAELSRAHGDRQGFYRLLEEGLARFPADQQLHEVRASGLQTLAIQECTTSELASLIAGLWKAVRADGATADTIADRLEQCRAWDRRHLGIAGDFDPWTESVHLLRKEGRHDEVRKVIHDGLDFCELVLTRARDLDPIHRIRGRLFLELGWPAEALRAFDEALGLDADDGRARAGREKAMTLLGQLHGGRD